MYTSELVEHLEWWRIATSGGIMRDVMPGGTPKDENQGLFSCQPEREAGRAKREEGQAATAAIQETDSGNGSRADGPAMDGKELLLMPRP